MPSPRIIRARRLRKEATTPEKRLWYKISNRQLCGEKFVRQEPIGPFIVDFCCREHKLVIEIDGWTHGTEEERAYDAARTNYLAAQGYQVIRFNNDEVMKNLDGVLETIVLHLVT